MTKRTMPAKSDQTGYATVHTDIVALLEAARRAAARSVNALMTASYWEIGRRIVEFEQGGQGRADYGETLLARLATDLTARFGRGFSRQNLQQMRLFYLAWPTDKICQTLSGKSASPQISQPSEVQSSRSQPFATQTYPAPSSTVRYNKTHQFAEHTAQAKATKNFREAFFNANAQALSMICCNPCRTKHH